MSNQIPEDVISEIRQSTDIVDVIGEYVQLKKQGRNYFGLCPFHGEKTPSFSVTQEKQIFRCFGCGKGGNVVTFLMEIEDFSFQEAIRYLAERNGIELPETALNTENSLSEENQDILSAYEWLTKLYHHLLRYTKDGKEGYQYFNERGITDDIIDKFQLGYAPNVNDFTTEFLKKKGYQAQTLVKAGFLSLHDDGHVTDRFRGRVVFPIRNHLGKTVGFGGRTIHDQEPKYLNSSESDLFQKGKMLYNFDLAKKHIRKLNEVVLFEGYMDTISAYQAGVKNGVATLGTSLTEMQAKLLKRYVDTVIICYDADKPGIEATYKAAVLLRQVGCQVKVANLKDGMDPDSYINTYGPDAFQHEVIKASHTFMSFYMRYFKRDYNLSLEGDRINYIEKILQQLATIESPIEREYYMKVLHDEYHVSMETLKEELEAYRQKLGTKKDKRNRERNTNKKTATYASKKLLPAFHNAERMLIAYLLQDSSIVDKVQEEIGASFNIDEHKIIVTHLYAFYEEGNPPDVSLFIEWLTDTHIKQVVAEIAMTSLQEDINDKELNDYIRLIKTQNSDMVHLESLKEEQRIAEQQNDPIRAAQIAMKIIDIHKQLSKSN
ncbi:DNA primase [Oceanobacillus halotolerans]|uniref:DNA primase n=1 Tax=Oceanobacillus halotolerans TaxID=2663380 RepID=UPI0013DD2D40|nr:DNA primase [Oceanobacillus halotolerans]